MPGALEGIRVVALESLAPAPFGCMILADMGAEVLCVGKPGKAPGSRGADPLSRGSRFVAIDVKSPAGRDAVLRLTDRADVFVEGFRPGVTERIGLGPEPCCERNPGLVYARMTGWGQSGPLAPTAGHDVNYIGITGALEPIGPGDRPPTPPLNLLGDFGAGGMLMALGICAALVERASSGRGQVIDAAIVDGAALLTASLWGMKAVGNWSAQRSSNLLDGGAPFYDVFEASDGYFLAVGALEFRFYREMIEGLELDLDKIPDRRDPREWPALRETLAARFRERTQGEWVEVFEGTDACVTPVHAPEDAIEDGHVRSRGLFTELEGVVQPSPAPRFSRTPSDARAAMEEPAAEVLGEWGFSEAEVDRLREQGTIA